MSATQAVLERKLRRETVSCRLCDAFDCTPYLEGRGFTIVRCDACGLFYVNPQPSLRELEQYYANYDRGNQWRTGEEGFNRGVRKVISQFKREGAVLDVGSGSGKFLRGLRELGFEVYGIEPSRQGCHYAQSMHGIVTFHGTVEAYVAAESKSKFGVVTLLNVLEHLKDPACTLRQLWHLTQNDGILVAVVPDARLHGLIGEVRRRLGFSDPFWMDIEHRPLVGFDPPHHLTSFEPRTLSALISRCGFRPVYLRNAPVVYNDDRWKNVAKVVLHALSEVLYGSSFKRLVVGYSTLIVARKTTERTSANG